MPDARLCAPADGISTPAPVSRLILLADANPRSARIAQGLLHTSGFDVIACSDGETAFRHANVHRPAALVLDPEFRGAHGLEILARLKRQPQPVPVVLTSRNECLREDFVVTTYPGLVFLPKPYDRHELITAVRGSIEARAKVAAAIGPDDGFAQAIVQGPTVGVLRTPVLEVGLCARGGFADTYFRMLPLDGQRSGLFVAEREVGPGDSAPAFRRLDQALDTAVGQGASPADVLWRADRSLRDSEDGILLSALALEMDARRQELILCRAGFHAPLVATPGGSPAEIHLPFGSLLGSSPTDGTARDLRTVRLPFPEDGALLLQSTGALLAVGQSIPDLGHRLFSGYLRTHAGSSIPAALEALLGLLGALGVQGPGQDLLLMVVRRPRPGGECDAAPPVR